MGERLFINRYEEGNWYEVIVMLAGISEQPAELIRYLSAESEKRQKSELALLAKRCLETSDASQDVEARIAVVDALITALALPSVEWGGGIGKFVEALEEIGDRRAVIPMIELFRKSMDGRRHFYFADFAQENVAHALGKMRDTRAIDALCESLENTSIRASTKAWIVQALGRIWSNKE